MTEQDLSQLKADAVQASKEEQTKLQALKNMVPEQRRIQARKKEFKELSAQHKVPPEELKDLKTELNNHIADYNRRRSQAEIEYKEAKERAKVLRENAEHARRIKNTQQQMIRRVSARKLLLRITVPITRKQSFRGHLKNTSVPRLRLMLNKKSTRELGRKKRR